MSGQRRLTQQERCEPSLGISLGVLCLILLGMFTIVANISVPDIQLTPAEWTVDL
jgi:hypothetical protein